MTPDSDAEIVQLYEGGMPIWRVAIQTGLRRCDVRNTLIRLGVPRRSVGTPGFTRADEALTLYRAGWSRVEVARRMGVSKSYVYSVTRKETPHPRLRRDPEAGRLAKDLSITSEEVLRTMICVCVLTGHDKGAKKIPCRTRK